VESTKPALLDIYYRLLTRFGHQGWWPGDTPFEVIVGAVLTQRTAWTNVEQAIGNLKTAGALTPRRMLKLHPMTMRKLVRPAGYYNQKAQRLRAVTRWLMAQCEGDVGKLADVPTETLRGELLMVNGIGPETADSILLYAFGRPIFVVDAYTARALERIGLIKTAMSYHQFQSFLEGCLPRDGELFNDFHAQFVALGKNYCRNKPLCKACPVRDICETGKRKLSS